MISLDTFINNTKGKRIALPNGNQDGQCLSLVQQYLIQCYGIPFEARGHAKVFGKNLVKEGLAIQVASPEKGDLIVYAGSLSNGFYGHIAIFISENKMYDQNNTTHDNKRAGYSTILSGNKTYFRIIKKKTQWTAGDYKLLVAKAVRKSHDLGNNIQIVGLLKGAKPYCTTKGFFDKAHLKVGTECKIDSIYIDSENRVWGAFGKYWLVLCNKDGTPQVEKL